MCLSAKAIHSDLCMFIHTRCKKLFLVHEKYKDMYAILIGWEICHLYPTRESVCRGHVEGATATIDWASTNRLYYLSDGGIWAKQQNSTPDAQLSS